MNGDPITLTIEGAALRTVDVDAVVDQLRSSPRLKRHFNRDTRITVVADHPDFGQVSWVYADGMIDGPTKIDAQPCPATYSDEQYPCDLALGHTEPHHFKGLTWHNPWPSIPHGPTP